MTTAARSQAYIRVVRTLEDMGPSKLQPEEQATVRVAADALLFADLDGGEGHGAAVTAIGDLTARLIDAGRWTPERAAELVDDVLACGPDVQVSATSAHAA